MISTSEWKSIIIQECQIRLIQIIMGKVLCIKEKGRMEKYEEELTTGWLPVHPW